VHPVHLLNRHGQHTVGILISEIVLCGERELADILDPIDVSDTHPGPEQLIPIEPGFARLKDGIFETHSLKGVKGFPIE
jgi:hypothetical protein